MRSDAAPPVVTASLGSHASQSRTPASNPILKLRFLQCSRQKNLLIYVKANLFEWVHTVKARGKGERS
jgi:hypothetical protein